MSAIIVVDHLRDRAAEIPGPEVVTATDYLTSPRFQETSGLRVYNLCQSYRYQTTGYYVSLLATARRHVPFPDLTTILEMKNTTMVRTVDDDLDRLIQKSLAGLKSDSFELSIYFGHNLARQHDRLAMRLFGLFPVPLMRARFRRGERWRLSSIVPLPMKEVPDAHLPFLIDSARDYFDKARYRQKKAARPRYLLAILHDPTKPELAPSQPRSIDRFIRAAKKEGFGCELITKDDASRIREFDALFIRETTYVNHHTFRLAQRAEAAGLAVVDDPQSILRCTNKVFLAEALAQKGIPTPKTIVVDREGVEGISAAVGLPAILKSPDSAFSQGVVKCKTEEEIREKAAAILEASDLLVAQEFLPTTFDWRIGVFDGRPLFACRYHMADGHWQIIGKDKKGAFTYGKTETLPIEEVPKRVLRHAVRASAAMGRGLYGVDIKESGRRCVVIEVNDNPNIDIGHEDRVLGEELYRIIARGLRARVEELERKS